MTTPAVPPPIPMIPLKLYDFTAPWCAPCKSMAPILREVKKLYPEVEIVKVNVDTRKGEDFATKYRIMSLPAFFVADATGERKLTRVRTGTLTVGEIRNMIEAARKAAANPTQEQHDAKEA